MSYCSNAPDAGARWVSATTYTTLRDSINAIFGATSPAVASQEMATVASTGSPVSSVAKQSQEEYLMVYGQVNLSENTVSFSSFSPVTLTIEEAEERRPDTGNYTLQALNSEGDILDEVQFRALPPLDAPNANFSSFGIPVSKDLDINEVRVLRDGNVLTSKTASPNAPTVTVETPNGGESLTGTQATIEWSGSDPDGDELSFIVQYSMNGGTSWKPLSVGTSQKSLVVNTSNLGGTDEGLIRVKASDGFNTAQDESDGTFSVPNTGPNTSISQPQQGAEIDTSATVVLKGDAADLEDGEVSGSNLRWRSSEDGQLGTGEALSVPASELSIGTHTITLEATDSNGATDEAKVTIEITQATPETDVGASTCSELDLSEITLQISDFDASQPDADTKEFVEVTNNGVDPIALSGCSMVFFDGADSKSYMAAGLGGTVEPGGTFTLGNPTVDGVDQVFSEGRLQDGPDALALYKAPASDFPEDTPTSTNFENRLSTVVYVSDDDIFGCYNASVSGCGTSKSAKTGEPVLKQLGDLVDQISKEQRPDKLVLKQNYPNPFGQKTTIRYALPEESDVKIVVYDILGREVKRLATGTRRSGWHRATLRAEDLSAGTYFVRLKAGKQVKTQSMKLLR